MKINAVLYDFMLVKGGAEAVMLDLCNGLDNLALGVGFVNREAFPNLSAVNFPLIELTQKTEFPGWQSLVVSHAFETKGNFVDEYEKVIFSGSNAPLAVKFRGEEGNILYCHTPPRFIYDLKEYYLDQAPVWQRILLKGLIAYLKPKYEHAIGKMNVIIANSINVQQRIKKFLCRDAIVIYPPCDIEKYTWIGQGDYYLSTARVEPYKRVKQIVEAFMQMPDKKLIVASGGSQLEKLRELASCCSNISFTGWCEEQTLKDLVGNCIATIYLPIDEDFGMSPVESMAAGKPVIGVNEGGVKETVIDNETGLLCNEQFSVEQLKLKINEMTPEYAVSLKENCVNQAQRFARDIFISKMKKLIDADVSELSVVAKSLDASR